MTAIANKACMCPRCGHRIDKGDPIRFESCQTMARPSAKSAVLGS